MVNASATSTALGVKAVMEANNHHKSNNSKMSPNELQQQQHHHSVNGHGSNNHLHHGGQHHLHHHNNHHNQAVPRIANGNILKTALTNPSEVLHLRRRLEGAVTSSRDPAGGVTLPYESAMPTICTLIYCDEFEDIATLKVNFFNYLYFNYVILMNGFIVG